MATVSKKSHAAVIELHGDNTEGQVRIVPMDRDIMAMPVEMAIEACRAFKQQIQFKDQFDLLNHRLFAWLTSHKGKLIDGYLTPRDAGLLFLVVTKGSERDKEIECALTELDLEIANDKDFNLISLTVHSIPASPQEIVHSFLSRKFILRYMLNGSREGAPSSRESDPEDH